MLPYNKNLVSNARNLRKNMTPEEKHLWYDFLKRLPVTVKRQHNIENYIVDFYIASKKVVIEIDGSQHYTTEHQQSDRQRDITLSNWGITVLRYSNKDINQNFRGVTEDILLKLGISFSELKIK
ncbi:MAG: endonuclease domain-containing protein [Clostridia bacterium]|nr:endonuclease domain-containing protein [Clostridia bacterium]